MSGERIEPLTTAPQRLGALARLPLFFALQGKRAVIAGGSPAAAWKASCCRQRVRVSTFMPSMLAANSCSSRPGVLLQAMPYCIAVAGRRLICAVQRLPSAIFPTTDGAAAFAAAARAAGVPVNVIDKPAHCDFSFGAIVNRSPLVVGISTDGAAPVFARAIRGRLEALLPKGFARWTAAAARWRTAVRASGLSVAGRRRFWELFAAHAMAHADDGPGQHDFERFVAEVNDSAGSGLERGAVTLVDVDGNDPDALTLRAVRALHAADVILFDEQVSHQILDFARREARKIRIGKIMRDGQIEALRTELASQGCARAATHVPQRPRRPSHCQAEVTPHGAAFGA